MLIAIIVRLAKNIPPDPIPATALPRINIVLLGAVAGRIDPSRKIVMTNTNTFFRGNI